MSLSDTLRNAVRKRAGGCCEYCRIANRSGTVPFHVDHITPRKHGGPDDDLNLCFACFNCNMYKGYNLTGIDPSTGAITPLFHPRQQVWDEHFEIQADMTIAGLTPEGRTTVLRQRCSPSPVERGPGGEVETNTVQPAKTPHPIMTLRGDRITQLRKKLGIRQTQLAEILEVSPNHVSKYENGYTNPPLDTLAKLAEFFNTTTDYLLGLSNIPHPGAEPDPHPDLTPTELAVLKLLRERSQADQKRVLGVLEAMRDMRGED